MLSGLLMMMLLLLSRWLSGIDAREADRRTLRPASMSSGLRALVFVRLYVRCCCCWSPPTACGAVAAPDPSSTGRAFSITSIAALIPPLSSPRGPLSILVSLLPSSGPRLSLLLPLGKPMLFRPLLSPLPTPPSCPAPLMLCCSTTSDPSWSLCLRCRTSESVRRGYSSFWSYSGSSAVCLLKLLAFSCRRGEI